RMFTRNLCCLQHNIGALMTPYQHVTLYCNILSSEISCTRMYSPSHEIHFSILFAAIITCCMPMRIASLFGLSVVVVTVFLLFSICSTGGTVCCGMTGSIATGVVVTVDESVAGAV